MEYLNTLKNLGDENILNNNYEKAIYYYELYLELNKDNQSIYLNRCFAYLKLENYDNALLDANKAIELKSDNPKAWSRLGSCLLGKDEDEEARMAFIKAYELDPTNEEYERLASEDKELDEIMGKIKNLTVINNIENEEEKISSLKEVIKKDLPKEAIPELEKMIPLDGIMGSIFNKMMNNKNLLKLLDNTDFQNKLTNYHTNPLAAMRDPQIVNLMKDIMQEPQLK